MNLYVKASFVTVEGGPVNHNLGCLAELEIACILYRTSSSKDRWNPTHEYGSVLIGVIRYSMVRYDTTSNQHFTYLTTIFSKDL